jgi:hypothetical protein
MGVYSMAALPALISEISRVILAVDRELAKNIFVSF